MSKKINRVFYSKCIDEIKPHILALSKLARSEVLDKSDLNIISPGKSGYDKYISKTLSPYINKFKYRLNKNPELKQKLWWFYEWFGMGGFIRRNYSFGDSVKDFWSDEIRGIDQHCAYPYLLGESCLHPEPLEECDLDPNKQYIEYAVYHFYFKMKPQYKDLALFGNPLCQYVDYLIEGEIRIGLPKPYWDFIQQLADFELIDKTQVRYFEDLGPILRADMQRFYNDRERLSGDEKLACKAMGCAAVGYLALKPKDGNKNVPLINPIADYWVCCRCRMRTLDMIKRVIDSGGLWIQSVTDSVYWIGGLKYEDLELSNSYGSWDKAIKGEPYHFRSITSGYYGIADKDGNKLVQKFSGFGDDTVWSKMLKHYMKTIPLTEWHSIETLRTLGDKIIKYLIDEAALNNCDLRNEFDRLKDAFNEIDKKGMILGRNHKGITARKIYRNREKNTKKGDKS